MKPVPAPLFHSAARRVRRRWLAWIAAFSVGAVFFPAHAGEAPKAKTTPGRYLIIVETSAAMQRRAPNIQQTLGELVVSGMNRQLKPGDTIGVWTFNEELNAGSFPLQTWSPQSRQRIAASVVGFLQNQRYEKRAQLDKAVEPMMRLIKDSEKITVLLVTDGAEKISGTPFDGEINENFRLNSAEQRRLRMPFVTVWRARKGAFSGFAVSVPPWPVEFPAFPVEPPPPEEPLVAKAEPKPETKPEPPPPTQPPLIVVGKKRQPAEAILTNATPPSTVQPDLEPRLPATTTTETKSPPLGETQPPNPSQPQATAVPSKPLLETETPASPSPAIVTPAQPKSAAPPEASPKPVAPAAVAKAEAAAPPAPSPVASPPATSSPETAISPKPASSTPAASPVFQTAVASPSETVFNSRWVLVGAIVLLCLGLALAYAFMRRARAPAQISLITRSMDRDKK